MRKVLGTILALVVVAGARADDSPASIVEKAIKAKGGKEKLAQLKAEQWKGKGVMHMGETKLPYTITYAFQQPNQLRFEMDAEFMGQKVKLTVVYDGKQAWEKMGDMLREMPKEKFEEFKHTVYVMQLSHLLPLTDKAYTLTVAGEVKVNDRAAVAIKVTAKGHRDVTLFFDKESGLLVKSMTRVVSEFTMKEVTQEVYFLDYKEKDGRKYFCKLVIKQDGKPFLEEEFSDQKSLEKLDAKTFAKP